MNLLLQKSARTQAHARRSEEINSERGADCAAVLTSGSGRACTAKSAAELEKWLLRLDELNAASEEDASRRYKRHDVPTDHPEAERRICISFEHSTGTQPRQFSHWRKCMSRIPSVNISPSLSSGLLLRPGGTRRKLELQPAMNLSMWGVDVKNPSSGPSGNVALEPRSNSPSNIKTHRRADVTFRGEEQNARADAVSRIRIVRCARKHGNCRQAPLARTCQVLGNI